MILVNCYQCKHRRDLPGDHHSRCVHPQAIEQNEGPLGEVLAIFASVGRIAPRHFISPSAKSLGIEADPHGIENGWFCWPYNFDPVWLQHCGGFEQKEVKTDKVSQ